MNDISLRLGPLEFRPSLIPTLATLLLLPMLVALGFWQLDRADQKRRLMTELAIRTGQPAVMAEELDEASTLRYRRASIVGNYLPGRLILLDNQVRGGRPGYLVFSPLRLAELDQLILVNRGWLPAGPTREIIPEPGEPSGEVRLEGVLDFPPRPGMRLGDSVVVAEGWPLVVLELDPNELAERLGSGVLPLSLHIDGDPDGRLMADPLPVQGFRPQRHLGYAAQWFGLAAVLVTVFLVLNTRVVGTSNGERDEH